MFDFIFRRGNPTNDWHQPPDLKLTAELDMPSLNGIRLGARFDQLSFLGRNDASHMGTLYYFSLGIGIDRAEDETFDGYVVVLDEHDQPCSPYRGTLLWKHGQLDLNQLTRDRLSEMFGEWYWIDTDADESIAFYEYPDYEMQIEMAPCGVVRRLLLTRCPLMSDPAQRDSYNVDKPWPPKFGS
ncbi:MAG: hypothetical protein MK110_01270 [Fuerstiella sp.]|nr:hypothetical protein [Fuerstiella sp.]